MFAQYRNCNWQYTMASTMTKIVDDGATGFVSDDWNGTVASVNKIRHLDRSRCREVFEERFTVERMVSHYLELYGQMLSMDARKPRRNAPASKGSSTFVGNGISTREEL